MNKRFQLNSTSNNQYRRYKQEPVNDVLNIETNSIQDDTKTHGSYGSLLFDKRWKSKREQIVNRDGYACVNCKGNLKLQIHHRQYHFIVSTNHFRLPWEYPNQLMVSLCEKCHQKGHSKFKVPIIKI